MRPSPNSASVATTIGTGVSMVPCIPAPATRRASGAIRAGETRGCAEVDMSRPRATVATTAPTRATRRASSRSPSHPAWRAPTTSRATRPRPTTAIVSAAIRRSRPVKVRTLPRATPVSTSSTTVRPPTPSQDHATARNVTAATSRHRAPKVSRILGTEAPDSRRLSKCVSRPVPVRPAVGYGVAPARGDPAGAGGDDGTPAGTRGVATSAVTSCCRNATSSSSARCKVVKSSTAVGPVSGRAQRQQVFGASPRTE